jgi:outer membrane protein
VDRHDLGLSLRQTLYRGGRVDAGVDAARSALAAEQAGVDAARSDLILAVRQAWYRVAQARRLVVSSEQGLERSLLNLEYADAQLEAGLGTRPDVLRARVDVSTAELELTQSRNTVSRAPKPP